MLCSVVRVCREPPWALCCSPESVVHIMVAIALCSVTCWLQTSGMVEDDTQRDSDDEWLEALLGQPGSSLTRRQTATAVSSVGAVASAPGSPAHVAAGTSFRALPAAATSKRTLRAPPSIEDIKSRRLEQEDLDSERERLAKGKVGSPSGEAPGGEPRSPPFRSQELRAITGALFFKVTLTRCL